jgi:hypothetical protein
LFPLTTFGTIQTRDLIEIDGDTFYLSSFPLDGYENKGVFNGDHENGIISSCLRNYRATWSIKNDSLKLLSVEKGCGINDSGFYDLKVAFGINEPFADWVNGDFLSSKGMLISRFQTNSETFFGQEIVLTFKNGVLIKRDDFENKIAYQSELTKKQTNIYKFVYERIDWDSIPNLKNDETLFIGIRSGSTSKPDSIWLVRSSTLKSIDRQVLNAMKKIDDWDIYTRNDNYYPLTWIVPIEINKKSRKEYTH